MSINLSITANSVQELVQNLGHLAVALSGAFQVKPADGSQTSTEPVVEEAVVVEATKPRTRKKKEAENAESGAHVDEARAGSATDVSSVHEGGSAAGVAANEPEGAGAGSGTAPADAGPGSTEQPAVDTNAAAVAPAEGAAAKVEAPALSYDELREHVISYLNDNFPTQQARTDEFRAVLGVFGIESMKQLPEDKRGDMMAEVDRRRAEKKAA